MFEKNYSYNVTAKKLSRNKGWVSKWTRHWKTNPAESLQSQSRRRLTNKTALNLTALRIIRKLYCKYQTSHSTGRLGSNSTDMSPGWKHLEHYGCSSAAVYASQEPQTLTALERHFQKSWEINFFDHSALGSMPDRLKFTTYKFLLSKSFMMMRITLYFVVF